MRSIVNRLDYGIAVAIASAIAVLVWSFARKRIGEAIMKSKSVQVSNIGISLFVISLAAGFAATAALQNPAPVIALSLVGLYFMFAIKVADQWERVAVLRLGRFIGMRGPGAFHMVPIVDTLSRFVDQRV